MSAVARIAELEERVAYLTDALGLSESYVMPFGLSRTHDRMIAALMKLSLVTRETMTAVLWSDASEMRDPRGLDVQIYKLRNRMRPWAVTIATIWSIGWKLDPADKQIIRRHVAEYQKSAA